MKRLIILYAFMLLNHAGYSQHLYKFYNVTMNARQILGNQKSTWLPMGANTERSKIISPAQTFENVYASLGGIYDYNDKESRKPLLNIAFNEYSPILDTININFYLGSLFKLTPLFVGDSTYKKFYSEFTQKNISCQQRKAILDERPEYQYYKTALANLRYSTNNSKSINLTNDVQRVFKISLSGKIKAALKNYNLSASTNDTIDLQFTQNVVSNDFEYFSVQLDPLYILTAKKFIKPHYANSAISSKLASYDDLFAGQLKTYLLSNSQSIISYATIIKARFTVKDIQNFTTAIGASIETSLQPAGTQSISEVRAAAQAAISKTLKQTLQTDGGITYYMICYARDPSLEIGKGEMSTPPLSPTNAR